MTTIYELSPSDKELLDLYCKVDQRSGEVFDDENCTKLVADWRELAEAEIARWTKKKGSRG